MPAIDVYLTPPSSAVAQDWSREITILVTGYGVNLDFYSSFLLFP